MTVYEHTMTFAIQKCAILQQEITNAMQYGLDCPNSDSPNTTNRQRILNEYTTLQSLMYTLINMDDPDTLSNKPEETDQKPQSSLSNLLQNILDKYYT